MEEVTRDFFEGVGPASSGVDPNNRLALHNIIKHVDVSHLDWKQVAVQLQWISNYFLFHQKST